MIGSVELQTNKPGEFGGGYQENVNYLQRSLNELIPDRMSSFLCFYVSWSRNAALPRYLILQLDIHQQTSTLHGTEFHTSWGPFLPRPFSSDFHTKTVHANIEFRADYALPEIQTSKEMHVPLDPMFHL